MQQECISIHHQLNSLHPIHDSSSRSEMEKKRMKQITDNLLTGEKKALSCEVVAHLLIMIVAGVQLGLYVCECVTQQ